ncbi:hypothetical protein DV735_g3034, partial [Chaetothyriales sp. CBS 134920]
MEQSANANTTTQDEQYVVTIDITKWTAFNGEKLAHDPTWHESSPPAELLSLPDGANIPPKLVEILNWSLQRRAYSSPIAAGDVTEQTDVRPAASSTPQPGSSDLQRKFSDVNAAKADVKLAIERVKTLKQQHNLERAKSRRLVQDVKRRMRPPPAECTSCFDEFPVRDLVKLPCNHLYCKQCLTTLITTALQNESAFPPKCCLTEIPPKMVIIPLDQQQRELYKEKAAEYSIPAGRRCVKICSICRGLHHKKGLCPEDFGFRDTLDIAELEGWKRCYRCRTLVERNEGCRHITCSCGAQFCYICGKIWGTCRCRESDFAARQAAARRNQALRAAAEEREREEVARATAEVERLAREEEERRRQQEAQRALEREREEAELARIEQIRLQEEQQRRQEEEEAERQLREALRISLQEEINAVVQALKDTIVHQHLSLDDRQRRQEKELRDQIQQHKASKSAGPSQVQLNIDQNIAKRKGKLKASHDSELQELEWKQQFEQDDVFLQIQLYLKDKPNREVREKRMYEELAKSQEDARRSLKEKHQTEREKLEQTASMELEGILRSRRSRQRLDEEQHRRKLDKLRHAVAAERTWFTTVQTRRRDMVQEHNKLVLQAFNDRVDIVGLTDELAAHVSPLPSQALRDDDGTSSVQNTPVELEAPVGLLSSLAPKPPQRKSLNSINQALAHLGQAPHSPTESFVSADEDPLELVERPARNSASTQRSLRTTNLLPPTATDTALSTNPFRARPKPTLLTPPESPPNLLIPDSSSPQQRPKSHSTGTATTPTFQPTLTIPQRPRAATSSLTPSLPRLDIPSRNHDQTFYPIPGTFPTVDAPEGPLALGTGDFIDGLTAEFSYH